MASMMAFLKRSPSDENANIAATRGETRKDYLERYLAFQINDHGGNLVSEKQEWHGKQKIKDSQQMTWKQLCDKYGEDKAKYWLDSNKLTKVADRITGSTDPIHAEFIVPEIWSRAEEGSKVGSLRQSEKQATEEDEANMKPVCIEAGDSIDLEKEPPAGSGGAIVPIKREPGAEADEEAARQNEAVEAFLTNVNGYHKRLQQYVMDSKMLVAKGDSMKYCETFSEDMKKHQKKLSKVTATLEKIVLGQPPRKEGMNMLIETTMNLIDAHQEMVAWGKRFGIELSGSSSTGGRKRKA